VIGGIALNHAFTGLHRDRDGLARVRVTDQQGLGVELACDESSRWIQVYTADAGAPEDRRHAVAVEPMTCPPDALNSKIDLITLAPGATHTMEWRIKRVKGLRR
jgi:aldose 1-epimerase